MQRIDRRTFLAAPAAALLVGCATPEQAADEPEAKASEEATFVPADFEPPKLVEGDGFILVPLDTEVTELDYKAYMSSIEHLQETFTHSTNWPRDGLTMEDAVKDMENEQAQWETRASFPYAVLDPERTKERGCVYVRPSKKEGYEAAVKLWVTADEYAAGFDAELYEWTKKWVEEAWPFEAVAYPEREIAKEEWETLPDKG